MKRRFALALVMLIQCQSLLAAQSCPNPEIAARIGDWQVDRGLLQQLFTVQRAQRMNLSPGRFLKNLIDDALLAQNAEAQLGEAAWGAENPVGFPLEVKLEDQRSSLAGMLLPERLETWTREMFHGPAADALEPVVRDSGRLQDLFRADSSLQAAPSDMALEALEQVPVAHFRWSDTEVQTLFASELWRRSNVQGKRALGQGELAVYDQAIGRWAQGLVINRWLTSDRSLTSTQTAFIRRYPEIQWLAAQARRRLGVLEIMHEPNPVLAERARNIPAGEVARYYRENRDEFRRIDRARGQRLFIADEQTALQAYDALDAGADFQTVARDLGLPDDVDVVAEHRPDASWADALFFTLPVDRLSGPVRRPTVGVNAAGSPDEPGWIIVKVTGRDESYLPVTDEAVRYQAGYAVARAALRREYSEKIEVLRKQIPLCVNDGWTRKGRSS